MRKVKKIFANIIAVMLVLAACLGMSACSADIRKVELTVKVYNYADDVNNFETVTLTVDLYRHLAPKTVDKILGYVDDDYYDGNVFYKMDDYSKQIMMGDLKATEENTIAQNAVKPQISGEFEKGGTVGSNLTNVKGAVGLWRSWYDVENDYKVSNASYGSGRATWYMPTESISSYNKLFCVFALIDFTNQTNSDTWELINAALSEKTQSYTIYYTGTYDKDKADEDYGLTFNCVETSMFDEDAVENLFTAKENTEQLVCYNHYEIKVPMTESGEIAAKVVSAKIK